MRLIFIFMLTNSFINAQDTLEYRNYIDYERRDPLATAKNTIITRDGNFLPDGLYCFTGYKKDFELLLKTNESVWSRADIKINGKSKLYLVGEIKDFIKVGVWTLKFKNNYSSKHNPIIPSEVWVENYLYAIGAKEARYKFFNNDMNCKIQSYSLGQRTLCRDAVNNVYFSETYAPLYFGETDVLSYERRVGCGYYVKYEEDKKKGRKNKRKTHSLLINDDVSIDARRQGDTIKTQFEVKIRQVPDIYVSLHITEVIRDNKLVYFNIDEQRNLPEKKENEFKGYNFYPEIMYNLAPCWELGR